MGLSTRRCWIEGDDLCFADAKRLVWRGRPDNAPVRSLVELPGVSDVVALLDHMAGPRNALGDVKGWPNLVRVSPGGDVIWRAASTDRQDVWVESRWEGGRLLAWTLGGWKETLDHATGRVLQRVFTK
jgi:hypothetical protein